MEQQKSIQFPPIEQRYVAMYKSELARKAGVSLDILRRWIKEDNIPVPKRCKMLPPVWVKYLCEKYVIILDE